ncbi:MAG: iron-containing alcohol dehydrogenase [Pseudomonadota bacterium]
MICHELAAVPPITMGAGATAVLSDILAKHLQGGAILLAADPGLAATGMIETIANQLRSAGLDVVMFSDFAADPSVTEVDAARATARSERCSLVIGLGGGSALDLAKATAGLAGTEEPTEAFALSATSMPADTALPFITVPTTSGTGAEMTRTSVLTLTSGAKAWFWDPAMRSAHVVLDPDLTLTLPPHLTAATGLDALVHALEAATNQNAHAGNAVYAEAAIRMVMRHLEVAVRDGADQTARAGMQHAAALAGMAIDNGGTAVAHAIGHALGSLGHVHHGRAVALALMAALPFNIAGAPARFQGVAEAMGLSTPEAIPETFDNLVRRVGLAVSLAEDCPSLTPELLAEHAVMPENVWMTQSNARALSHDDLVGLCRTVLTQA